MIPLFDLDLRAEDVDAVEAALRSGTLQDGPLVAELESVFAGRLGVRHAVALSSATAALWLAYRAAGVGPGDEVVVPAYTFAATAAAAVHCGATPVFADVVGPDDLSIDARDVTVKLSPRTKAVACVHFGGYAAPAEELRELCDEHGIHLVEDAAHAPTGTTASGRPLGSIGHSGCFSFFSNKVISCGEGGLLATDDDEVAALARAERAESRMDEPRAALLLSRLRRLEDEVAARQDRTRRYRELLAGLDGITCPYEDDEVARSACYVMPVLVDDAGRRDALRIALRERHDVQTSLLYPPTHRFSAYRERWPGVELPRTEDTAAREVTLPLFPHLTDDDQDRVVEALRQELAA